MRTSCKARLVEERGGKEIRFDSTQFLLLIHNLMMDLMVCSLPRYTYELKDDKFHNFLILCINVLLAP